VFEGDLLHARLWLPDSAAKALYVTFRQRVADPGQFSDQGPGQRALAAGLAHLHIQTRWNDWYLNAETTALQSALAALRLRFDTARAVGYSMGGYAALRFASALALDQALVISPQFTLDRRLIPEERRYPEARRFDAVLGDLATFAKPDLNGVVLFDPSRRLDRTHAKRIVSVMPGMALARCAFGGHPATTALRDAGGFRALQALGLNAPLRAGDVIRLHRRLRAGSAHYWHHRAQACMERGRLADAETALTRAEALGDVFAD
jgi:hypothetical protein